MGSIPAAEVDAWLRAGGIVVAASDRAARALKATFHRARRAEGLAAWPAPHIFDWSTFVRSAWEQRAANARIVLNAAQERSLWASIVANSGFTAGWLDGPRHRLADLALEGHQLLCAYAPTLLRAAARAAWQQDPAALSHWLTTFEDACTGNGYATASRLPLELEPLLTSDSSGRPPLVLAGFDRMLPTQQSVFDAWGSWQHISLAGSAHDIRAYSAPDATSELAACAQWCHRHLAANPGARLLVITQDAAQRRGEIERAFLRSAGPTQSPPFEFSLGIPISKVGLARSALLLLRWLDGSLAEHEIDWLLSTGTAAARPEEPPALQSYMRALRRHGLERPRWTLDAFLRQSSSSPPPTAWVRRMKQAHERLRTSQTSQSPLEWAGLVPQLLQLTGWPGPSPDCAPGPSPREQGGPPGSSSPRRLTSAEFQAMRRWQQVVDLCGSLGFDGRHIAWPDFLSELTRALEETLFAEESQDAPILIAGPAESAGLTADAIWFLGADEDSWPAPGNAHPLLPIHVQREARMPHASPQQDWELAESITRRLLASAPQIRFSYARQKDGVEVRPSRLVDLLAGTPQTLPAELAAEPRSTPRTIAFEDTLQIPLAPTPAPAPIKSRSGQLSLFDDTPPPPEFIREIKGGSTVLTSQSQCAFKAFATARLGAQAWEPAQPGLTPSQRGQLLHAVLHSIWGSPPQGIRMIAALKSIPDLKSFVLDHVQRVLAAKMPAGAREHMPQRYLELEETRLTSLVAEWLDYERTRLPFTVEATERDAVITIAGLTLNLRLDRVDRLSDDTLLVIDYKSGNVTTRSWDLPRPDDVQLPLYAGFALSPADTLGGLTFAKVRRGNMCFAGKVRDARATLDSTLSSSSGLVKDSLTAQQLDQWKKHIEQLACDFLAGRADVNPRDYPATCDRCGLYALCRVREREDELEPEDEEAVEAEHE